MLFMQVLAGIGNATNYINKRQKASQTKRKARKAFQKKLQKK